MLFPGTAARDVHRSGQEGSEAAASACSCKSPPRESRLESGWETAMDFTQRAPHAADTVPE